MKKLILFFFSFIFIQLLIANKAYANKNLKIYVSIPPQKFFLERIAGDKAEIKVLLSEGSSPAHYSPNPRVVSDLLKSDLFFSIGVPYERGINDFLKENDSTLTVVDTVAGIKLRKIKSAAELLSDKTEDHKHEEGHKHEEDHKHEEEHKHADHHRDNHHHENHHHHSHKGGKDPHIWLDPVLVIKQSRTICDALIKLDPDSKDYYQKNLEQFIIKLNELDKRLTTNLAPFAMKEVIVFHPSLGYFTDRYKLRQIAIETEGKTPKGKYLSKIIELIKNRKIRAILIQSEFDSRIASKVASVAGVKVIKINPLSDNYFENLKTLSLDIIDSFE